MDTFYNDCLSMIESAIKAPSGHNIQPWLFKINESSICIHPNWEVALPIVDPHNRELFISIGAALENLIIMAHTIGYDATYTYDSVAKAVTVNLKKNNNLIKNKLVDLISIRQTNRQKYTGEIIDKKSLKKLQAINFEDNINLFLISNNDPNFRVLTTYIEEGNNIQMSDKY